jgi:exodeoxyribonuclease VII small subunit
MTGKDMAPKKTPQTFESALERVEQIAAQMETGDLPLDHLVRVYEEGLRLVRFCSERLEEAEKRLQVITRDATGQPQGLEAVQNPGEIPPSTPPESSVTEEDSSGPEGPSDPARLF